MTLFAEPLDAQAVANLELYPPPLLQLSPFLMVVLVWQHDQVLLDTIVSQKVVAKVLHGSKHFLTRRNNLRLRQQKTVASRIPQFDLVGIPCIQLV